MIIKCPQCHQKHKVDPARIPYQKFQAGCKFCGFKFLVRIITCPACQHRQTNEARCENCGALSSAAEDAGRSAPQEPRLKPLTPEAGDSAPPPADLSQNTEDIPAPPPVTQHFRPEFTGTGAEFFRIWLVNLFLTIITFGIYLAWAKVRTRKYFYAHTRLAGYPFDYTANPIGILKGNLIIFTSFLMYSLVGKFSPVLGGLTALIFAMLFPLLIYKSLRFFAHNSVYRNIRFRFLGSRKESYKIYLLFPVLIPLTLGLFLPYWAFRQKKYFYDNMAFGEAVNIFEGRPRTFYAIYGIAFLLVIAPAIVLAGAFVGLPHLLAATFFVSPGALPAGPIPIGATAGLVAGYFGVLTAFIFLQQYIFVRLTNYSWSVSTLGKISFTCTLKTRTLLWISVSNLAAVIFSLGLLIPWAKVRRTRYLLDSLTVTTNQGLDIFMAVVEPDENAIGEAATDFFDFEIGL